MALGLWVLSSKGICANLETYLERSEMYHTVNIWMFLKDPIKRPLFGNISLEKFRSLSTDDFDAIDRFF